MGSGFRAIALDYDGTLTDADRPDDDVLAAIRSTRRAGRVVVLVTGRILSELRAVFPEVDREFDAIVAENGAVLADGDGVRDLATPIDPSLGQILAHREVPVRQGRVLLACEAGHDRVVVDEVARLGLDCQLVRNRAALMVLPAGVTKGTGLMQALGNLGVSRHSTLAVGDAENDHHLLGVCELGVAVANAVDALKERADLVLSASDGSGVAELLAGPLVTGGRSLPPRGWQITLGHDELGDPVRIPASQVNVMIAGGSCSGKSYVTGLLVEQLVRLDYSVLVLDREGDHRALPERRGILSVGGKDPLPTPNHLAALLRHRFGSVVVDLSQHGEQEQRAYVAEVAPAILSQRAVTGLPHWIFFDEAHTLPLDATHWADPLGAGDKGFCFSTYQPDALPPVVRDAADLLVLTAGGRVEKDQARRHVADATGAHEGELGRRLGQQRGRAALVEVGGAEPPMVFTVQPRSTSHVRHWHKYIDAELAGPLRFYFDDDRGRVAANVRQFHRHLGAVSTTSLEDHARRHDFSRWIHRVLQDETLAETIAEAEGQFRRQQLSTEAVRDVMRAAIESRYLE